MAVLLFWKKKRLEVWFEGVQRGFMSERKRKVSPCRGAEDRKWLGGGGGGVSDRVRYVDVDVWHTVQDRPHHLQMSNPGFSSNHERMSCLLL